LSFVKGDDQRPPHDLLNLFTPSQDPNEFLEQRQNAPHKLPTFELDEIYLQILKHSFKTVEDEHDKLELATI
jgi:hypothetical protein